MKEQIQKKNFYHLPLIRQHKNDFEIEPCPQCLSPMICHNTAHFTPEVTTSYFVMVCSLCKDGPLCAFPTSVEALSHWNSLVRGKRLTHNQTNYMCKRQSVELWS